MNENDASKIFGVGSYEGLLAMLGLPEWATVGEAVFAMECRHPEVEGARQWASCLWDTPPAEEITMITEVEVDRLRYQAAAADDRAIEHLCERALLGDIKAWRECERFLRELHAVLPW